MHQDRMERRDHDRALLRIRLAGIALGTTLLVLSPRSDQMAAAAALLGYAAAVLIQRTAAGRRFPLRTLAVAIDILYSAALSFIVPLSAGTWALYAFAIGTAAMDFGALGAAIATAGSIVAYDLVIASRTDELRASDLWPVQLLLAIGLLVAELVWSATRGAVTGRRLRTFALAQRDLIASRDEDDLLDRLADHAVRSFGAVCAWVESGSGTQVTLRHARGQGLIEERPVSPTAPAWPLDEASVTRLRCTFGDPSAADAAAPVIRDLVTDAAPLLAAARERSRLDHAQATLGRTLDGIRSLERDRVPNAVLAEALRVATAIVGPAALVRPADGTIIAGDLGPADALALLRDTRPPALVRGGSGEALGAVVSAGPGIALVASKARQDLTVDDLRALTVLGEIAAAAAERMSERDALVARGTALERQITDLGEQVRLRDDAVASAVHELRTPLTSVHAYAQLTSRNLQAVQQQVKQLDRLIADLLRSPGASRVGLEVADVDLLQEAKQAGRRVALVSSRRIDVNAIAKGPFTLRGDRSRLEQVMENLLSNAVKFSPADTDIDVEIDRAEHEVVLSVSDHGAGIPAPELGRIFERYYRGADFRDRVAGNGIGLAVAREIVVAHGGRIWAASEGPGKGSTFFVALPITQPDAPEAVESGDVRGARPEAARQA